MVHYRKRLTIAKEFGDIRAKRRSRINLANSQMMAKDIIGALKNYLKAYQISMQLYELPLMPSLCQQLGYCCILLKRPLVAIIYHLRGLSISIVCNDYQLMLNSIVDLIKDYSMVDDSEFHKKSKMFYTWSLLLMQDHEGLQYPSLEEIKKTLSTVINVEDKISSEICDETVKCHDKDWLEEEIKIVYSIIKEGKQILDYNDKENQSNLIKPQDVKVSEDADPVENNPIDDAVFEHVISGLDLVVVTLQEDGKSCSRHPFKNPDQIIFETYDGDNKMIMNQIPSINSAYNPNSVKANSNTEPQTNSHEDFDRFLSLVSQVQSRRLDEQRCNLPNAISTYEDSGHGNSSNITSQTRRIPDSARQGNTNENPNNQDYDESFFNLVAGLQSLRMDDQRATLPDFPGLIRGPSNSRLILSPIDESDPTIRNQNLTNDLNSGSCIPNQTAKSGSQINTAFFEMIMRCQAETRIDDQRSNLPSSSTQPQIPSVSESHKPKVFSNFSNNLNNQEDFFDLVQKMQSNRYDEQRCYFPMLMNLPSSSNTGQSSSVPHSQSIKSEQSTSNKKKARSNSTKKNKS